MEITTKAKELFEEYLYEVCDREHASCNNYCPVYKLNHSSVVNPTESDYGCECFKNGKKMLEFIVENT